MTKSILIVTATDLEIKPLLLNRDLEFSADENLKRFKFGNKKIYILTTTMGMVATSFHLTRALCNHKYDYVINAGICGAFDKSLLLGDVVNIVDETFAEIAVDTSNGLTPIKLGVSLNEKMLLTSLRNENPLSTPALQNLIKTKGITVNTISGSQQRIDYFLKTHAPGVESMEGASFLYVCNAFNQTCAQIRSISNYVGDIDKKDWNIELAVNNLSETILSVIREL